MIGFSHREHVSQVLKMPIAPEVLKSVGLTSGLSLREHVLGFLAIS